LPQLLRKDFVQHSNDSAWLVNPAQPLTGFSPLISQDGQPLGLRSRFALDRLSTLSKKGPLAVKDLQQMVMDDQVYLATQVVPDLLKFCASDLGVDAPALKPVCTSLKAWDGRANLDSGMGLMHFHNIMQALQASPDVWRVAFDPKDAQHTPRGLAIEQPTVAKALREAMLVSVESSTKMGLKPQTRWGDIQVVSSGGQQTPIHGGPGTLGIYNAIQSVPREDGKLEVVSGTSYLQVVTFDEKGPHAQGLLAFSLSSDPASKYSRDQTEAFSKKQWSVLPFTEQQIQADPQYQVQTVRQTLDKAGKVAAQ
jgi:acyl-homoserine-lactone acylase